VGWYKQSLFDLHVSPLYTDMIFYPFGYNLVSGSATLAPAILSLPLTLLWGHIVAYNLVDLLSYVLAGFGAYVLVMKLTDSRLAGMAGGIIFGFSPRLVSLLTAGHFNLLVGVVWLPYLMLCLEQMLTDAEPRWGIAAGIFCVLSVFSEWYFVPMLGLILGMFFLGRVKPWRSYLQDRAFVISMVTLGGILLLSIGVAVGITPALWQEVARTPYSLAYVDYISPSLDYFIIPYFLRTLLGRPAISPDAYAIGLPVYVGVLSVILAALGCLGRRDRVVRNVMWLCLGALLLALGPRLRWNGSPVLIPVPLGVEKLFKAGMHFLATRLAFTSMPSYYALHRPGTVYVPLPAFAVQLFVPFMSKMRYWERFSFVLNLGLAILAGFGVACLEASLSRALFRAQKRYRVTLEKTAAVAVVAGLALQSACVPHHIGYSEVRPQPVDLWLAEQSDDVAIAEFPHQKEGGPGPSLYRTLFHNKRTCSGAGTFPPADHLAARPLLQEFPSQETISLLKEWSPTYVLAGAYSYGGQWAEVQEQIMARPDLRLVMVFDETPIYHDIGMGNWVPGYDREWVVDRIYLYELTKD
jgi:hypothetical protein